MELKMMMSLLMLVGLCTHTTASTGRGRARDRTDRSTCINNIRDVAPTRTESSQKVLNNYLELCKACDGKGLVQVKNHPFAQLSLPSLDNAEDDEKISEIRGTKDEMELYGIVPETDKELSPVPSKEVETLRKMLIVKPCLRCLKHRNRESDYARNCRRNRGEPIKACRRCRNERSMAWLIFKVYVKKETGFDIKRKHMSWIDGNAIQGEVMEKICPKGWLKEKFGFRPGSTKSKSDEEKERKYLGIQRMNLETKIAEWIDVQRREPKYFKKGGMARLKDPKSPIAEQLQLDPQNASGLEILGVQDGKVTIQANGIKVPVPKCELIALKTPEEKLKDNCKYYVRVTNFAKKMWGWFSEFSEDQKDEIVQLRKDARLPIKDAVCTKNAGAHPLDPQKLISVDPKKAWYQTEVEESFVNYGQKAETFKTKRNRHSIEKYSMESLRVTKEKMIKEIAQLNTFFKANNSKICIPSKEVRAKYTRCVKLEQALKYFRKKGDIMKSDKYTFKLKKKIRGYYSDLGEKDPRLSKPINIDYFFEKGEVLIPIYQGQGVYAAREQSPKMPSMMCVCTPDWTKCAWIYLLDVHGWNRDCDVIYTKK